MDFMNDPEGIERRSMEIIEERLHDFPFDPLQKPVIKRVVHTMGDPSFAPLILFSPGVVEAGIEALLAGAPIFCDVEMARAGISRPISKELGIEVGCLIHDPLVSEQAKEQGTTRAVAAMRHALKANPEGAIFVIGNAPTALFVLLEEVEAGRAKPALVVGVPVGFVGAAESKEWLTSFTIPWITVQGEKGGSTVAAAIVNALLRMAKEKKGA